MAQPEMDHRDAASQKALSADEDQPSASAVPANESVARGNQFRRWSRRQIAFSAALWLVGVIFLIALSLAAQRYAEFPGDVGLAIWIQQLHQPILMHIVNFASDANWPYPAGAIAISVIVLLLLRRRVLDAFCVALAGFGADLLNVTLNSWVARPRPNNVQ
ncbi:MAG TPA: hypothetical protein VFU69_03725, partial [Ktedonobacterales bacterium]|nr:hypothetical protein [Ktedonobacterales bacterium]